MWFTNVAKIQDPGRIELVEFTRDVEVFLGFVLQADEFDFLWRKAPQIKLLATETYQGDVRPEAARLREAIERIPGASLQNHGLSGRALRFKFSVLDHIGSQWERFQGQFSVRDWLKRIIDAIDAILDSLIDAAGGTGGLIKEFKDALAALA